MSLFLATKVRNSFKMWKKHFWLISLLYVRMQAFPNYFYMHSKYLVFKNLECVWTTLLATLEISGWMVLWMVGYGYQCISIWISQRFFLSLLQSAVSILILPLLYNYKSTHYYYIFGPRFSRTKCTLKPPISYLVLGQKKIQFPTS